MNTETLTPAYTIERLNVSKLSDVDDLHEAVYGRRVAHDFFLKKYDTAFTGVEYMGFVAYNTERVAVGYYAVIPCFIQIGNRKVLSAQSADTMTHPGYRFKGLFVELSNLTFRLCRENGIALLFGFPNQNSLPGAIGKLGWKMTEQMDCFIIPTRGLKWLNIIKKLPVIKDIQDNYQQRLLNRYSIEQHGIVNSSVIDGFAGINRNEAYLQYKTYTQTYVINLGGAFLWVKINSELLIGDILLGTADFDEMMIRLKKIGRKLGINSLQFHCSPGTKLHQLFADRFKAIPSFPALFQCFEDGLPVDQIKFTSADIDTF